jgi:hypothetical protein
MNAAPEFAPVSAPDYVSADMIDSSSPSSSSSSMSSLLLRALLVIILLALIGFNVFTYLDDITQWFSDTFGAPFREVARFLGYAATDTVKTTVDVTAKGAKSAVDIAAGATTSGIDVLQKTIGGGGEGIKASNTTSASASSTSSIGSTSTSTRSTNTNRAESTLENALSHAKKEPPQPDDATSRTQRSSGKAGYCYIGEDRGFRSCLKVGEQDTCMSGDIFPTHAVCINPRLRE